MKLLLTVLCIFAVVRAEFNVTVGGYFYFISHPLKLNWFQALRYCRYINMHLIDISTVDEINRIGGVINFFKIQNPELETNNQFTNFWTSGCDHGDNSNYYWVSNGRSFGVVNWAARQPDNLFRLEHCVEMQHFFPYQWNDEFCDYNKQFICRDRVVLPAEQIHQMDTQRPNQPISDSEKPLRVANASMGFTHVSLI